MQTKIDILTMRAEDARQQYEKLRRELAGLEATPFGRPCAACGEMLATEYDFAAHFIVPDERYLNLGFCPTEGDITQRARRMTQRPMKESK